MKNKKTTSLLALLLCAWNVHASERSTVTFAIDNDGLFGVDQDYTNGLFFSRTLQAPLTPPLAVYPIEFVNVGRSVPGQSRVVHWS
ncbi:hypothetical protein QW180_16610 [Vibrio sinaloensis]|nr:hypothetical protein [Vibrio sinaloensis]